MGIYPHSLERNKNEITKGGNMSVFKKFEKSYLARYNNSLHAAYHTAQLKQLQAVAEETLEAMHVSGEQLEGYVITVDDLTERSMEAQASTATGDTTALDVERDRLLSMLYFLVASGLLSAVAEEQAAAKTLDVILRVYKGIQGKAMDVETQMIRGLLVDLKKDEAAAAVTTLRLNEILTQLETVNDKFEEVKDVGKAPAGQDTRFAPACRHAVGRNPGLDPCDGHYRGDRPGIGGFVGDGERFDG